MDDGAGVASPHEIVSAFRARLRRPASSSSVPGSLPVLFFGDLPAARVATVGLNPSKQEYLDRSEHELTGPRRRFQTLTSLGAATRQTLSDDQADRAIDTMRAYFHAGKPVYPWFDHLNRVVGSLDAAYETGYAAHLDLVQEATNPTWSRLASVRPAEASVLLQADLPFLRWEIGAFSLELVLCNGRTVFDQIMGLLNGTLVHTGNAKRTTWWMAQATVGQRAVGVGGWNMPLVRPTGLGVSGEMELGSTLRVAAQSIRPEL